MIRKAAEKHVDGETGQSILGDCINATVGYKILAEKTGKNPKILSSNIQQLGEFGSNWPDTILIIGDKVVAHDLDAQYAYQLDLGQAWRDQTGVPFVFALWMGRADLDPQLVKKANMLLDRQLRYNMHRLEQVVSAQASSRGWESDIALQYLTRNIQYTFNQEHVDSLTKFYELAAACDVFDTIRPLSFYSD